MDAKKNKIEVSTDQDQAEVKWDTYSHITTWRRLSVSQNRARRVNGLWNMRGAAI